MTQTICISGGFSILHFGHIRLIHEASKHGDLIVILNTDEWLERKYGKVVVPFNQRAEIMNSIKGVYAVVEAEDEDDTVCKSLCKLKPNYFANGGDRTLDNTPEIMTCLEFGIATLWGVGGPKLASSSELLKEI